MFQRRLFKIDLGEGLIKYRVRIDGDECKLGTQFDRRDQQRFLQTLIENPEILHCGPLTFEKMSIAHNGENWTAELEAIDRPIRGERLGTEDTASGTERHK